nr:RCC1 repeat-containing protein [Myxococcus sp. MH1]
MSHPSSSRLRGVLGITLGLLLSVGCGQQEAGVDHPAEGRHEAAISRTRPRVKLAANRRHSLAIRSDGTVWAAGQNLRGQLGQPGTASTATPVQVPGLTSITSVATGDYHSVALRSGGTVWTWGDGSHGQLGTPDFPYGPVGFRPTPVQVPNLTGVVAVAAGDMHTLAVKGDGTVWAWGYNGEGQLGDGGVDSTRYAPAPVPGLTNVVAVFARYMTSCAIRSDSTLWCWGSNQFGMMGIGSTQGNSMVPVQVPGLTNVVAVSIGPRHTLAAKSDGTVWSWGMQDPTTYTFHLSPVQVAGLTGVTDVSAGLDTSFALKSNGTVWSWGENTQGQLGDGTKQRRATPVQVSGLTGVSVVAGGETHALALRSDGTLWTWGTSHEGERGDGAVTLYPLPGLIPLTEPALAVAAGAAHSLLLSAQGTVWSWGSNEAGQLGDGTTSRRVLPAPVAGLQNVIAIAAAGRTSLALRDDNTVWAWGGGTLTPTQVPGLQNIIAISTSATHRLALRDDSTIFAWGDNTHGALGDGTLVSRTTPVQVSNLSDVMKVVAGPHTSYAIRYDGSAWAWGRNDYGQLADTTTTQRLTPVLIPGLSNVLAIGGGTHHGMALLADGSGMSWGHGASRAGMGLGSPSNYSPRPMVIPGMLEVVTSEDASAAITLTGELWTGGNTPWGQAGNGAWSGGAAPVQVSGITSGVTSLAVGGEHMLVVQPDGTVWSWGSNSDGQLGRGQPLDALIPIPSLLD